MPGLVEFDPAEMAGAALDVAAATLADLSSAVEAVGVTAQRASAVAWNGRTGEPVGPGIGWQDLRTVGTCLELQGEGIRFSPSESATKFAWLMDQVDASEREHVRVGTVDSWIAWHLTRGKLHVTDPSNAGVTGLFKTDGTGWNDIHLDRLKLTPASLPRVVDSSGLLGPADALPGSPPWAPSSGISRRL